MPLHQFFRMPTRCLTSFCFGICASLGGLFILCHLCPQPWIMLGDQARANKKSRPPSLALLRHCVISAAVAELHGTPCSGSVSAVDAALVNRTTMAYVQQTKTPSLKNGTELDVKRSAVPIALRVGDANVLVDVSNFSGCMLEGSGSGRAFLVHAESSFAPDATQHWTFPQAEVCGNSQPLCEDGLQLPFPPAVPCLDTTRWACADGPTRVFSTQSMRFCVDGLYRAAFWIKRCLRVMLA